MSTGQTWQTESTSLDDTLRLAEQIGRRLHGGEVIEMISDLGGGKTTFVRGLARGMGSRDQVHSPSFTLSNEYVAGDLRLHHFDFYRLQEPGIMRAELAEVLEDPRAVVVVEWPAMVEAVLPARRLTIKLRPTGETKRAMDFMFPQQLAYLISTNT